MGGAAAAASKLAAEDPPAAKTASARAGEAPVAEAKPSQAVSFDPARQPAAAAASSAQAPRRQDSASEDPTRGGGGGASSSLHVNRRASGGAEGSTGEPASVGALAGRGPAAQPLVELDDADAEEAMQRAIEASISENNQKIAGLGVDDRRLRPSTLLPIQREAPAGVEGRDTRGRTMSSNAGGPLERASRGGYRPQAQPAKAATVGLGGCAWVDNSDFHNVRSNQMLANREVAHTRSASCNAAPGRGRSTIVSLPSIHRPAAKEQQAMVKDLHESILETVSSPDESPYSGMGSLADLNLEIKEHGRESSVHRGGRVSSTRGAGYNAQFHSCKNEDAGNGTPRRR